MSTPVAPAPPVRRVVFCTYPSLYSDLVLNELLKSPQIELVGVVLSTRVLSKNLGMLRASIRQIQLSGLRYASYLFAVTDGYRGLRWLFQKPDLHRQLRGRGVPVLQTQDINAVDSLHFVRQCQPEVMLSAHFNQLLKAEVLSIPSLACVNIHPSVLPALQGVDPAFYALLRRVQETGVTVHLQDEQFDHGRILEQTLLKPRWQDSLLILNMKLFKLGAVSAVRQIIALNAETTGTAQAVGGQYDSWPNPRDTRQFRQQFKYFRWREYLTFIRHSS